MTKHITGFIAGLVFYRFFPLYAFVAFIIAAIVLAILLEAKHSFLKKLQKGRRKAKRALPPMKATKRQSRTKQA